METFERKRLMTLAASWRTRADQLLDKWRQLGKWYSAYSDEEKKQYLQDSAHGAGLYEASNELRRLVETLSEEKTA